MDAADLLESPEALLTHLDVEVNLVVECAFLVVQFGQPEGVPRNAEGVEVEPLDLHEVPHVPGGQPSSDEVLRGDLEGPRAVLLRRPRDADGDRGDRIEGQRVAERRGIEEDLEFRLEKFPRSEEHTSELQSHSE